MFSFPWFFSELKCNRTHDYKLIQVWIPTEIVEIIFLGHVHSMLTFSLRWVKIVSEIENIEHKLRLLPEFQILV